MFTARNALMWVTSSVAVGLLSNLALAQQAHLVAEEVREFEILVKGQSCGSNRIKIIDTDDGMTLVTAEVSLALDYIVYTYRYEFHGKEAWQGARLVWVDDWAIDAGKKLSARARVDTRGSIVDANGKSNRSAPVLDMTTSYWRAPPIGGKSQRCSLLDADQGTVHVANVEPLGMESINVMDRKLDAAHFRFSGGVTVDLWVDDQGRMVWQKAVEEGYPTELRLKRLIKNTATARAPTPTQR
jgi:hypothetical protein